LHSDRGVRQRATRIIVVEDRPTLRRLLVDVLEDAGYEAHGFASAADALGHLPDLRPDLVLLDMHLPGMDGRQFLEHLRSCGRWGHLPVLIVSGFGETAPPSADRTLAVLAKPFDNATLMAWVEQMLGRQPVPAAS
jgi:CheY-like chemotaxis protein